MASYIIHDCDLQEYEEEDNINKEDFMYYLDKILKEKKKDVILNNENLKDIAQVELLEKIMYDIEKENYL